MRLLRPIGLLAIGAALVLAGRPCRAASHSDAPLIKLDPQANLTDVYAFVGRYGGPPPTNMAKYLSIIVHVRPFSEPGDGVIYERFSPDALYTIHLADPATGKEICRYEFRFSAVSAQGGMYKNVDTILSYGRGANIGGGPDVGAINHVGDAHQNFTQSYEITKVQGKRRTRLVHAGGPLLVPPPNVGPRTTPFYNDMDGRALSGATSYASLDRYTQETVYPLGSGEICFAGTREDGFFADTPGIFDLLNPRILAPDLGQTGPGTDDFKGFNVLDYSLQIPVAQLGGASAIGVYASVSRPSFSLLSNSGELRPSTKFVQVNRMGNPLFNEVLVALRDKDRYNRTAPPGDAAYAGYALNPEVAVLINAVFGTSFQTTNRTDLRGIYIPDVLRIDLTTEPVRLAGQAGFSRLSVFGGDTTASGTPSGWPNGRRLGDDVVDIALTAVASGPSFSTITLVGDNVLLNDQVYNQVFPYSATPWSGIFTRKDPPAGPPP
jgi:hypothetical protein